MKVACAGSRFHGGQVDRIEQGFVQLGHELTPHWHEADLIYANDPGHYEQILVDRAAGRLRGKVILNVLDIPLHIPTYDKAALARQLVQADAVTAISHWTAQQVREHCGIKAEVVYNPIKPIHRTHPLFKDTQSRQFTLLSVGRRSDPNKRSLLWTHAMQLLGGFHAISEIALVGNEQWWGDYQGVLSDEDLITFYNRTHFVAATGFIEGLNLPVLEAMAAGAIPIVCRDMTTRTELLPPDLFPEYEEVEPTATSVARFIARFLNSETAMILMKDRLHTHYMITWADRVSSAGVARRIVDVYQSL